MKIAVFEREGRVSRLCEAAARVAIVEVDRQNNLVVGAVALSPAPQTPDALAGWLKEARVEVVLASGFGSQVRDTLEHLGLRVIAGVPPFGIEAALAGFLAGTLSTGIDACE